MAWWIRRTSVGGKRLLGWYVLLVGLWIILGGWQVGLGSLLVISLVFVAWVVGKIWTNGLVIRRAEYVIGHELYEIRDNIFIKNVSKSWRELVLADRAIMVSRVFLNNHDDWAYLSGVREILALAKRRRVRRMLLLGGAGGSLAIGCARMFDKALVEVVELEKEMINVFNRHFAEVGADVSARVSMVNSDANDYLTSNRQKYDVIIVDVFEHDELPGFVCSQKFMDLLNTRLTDQGWLLSNLGAANSMSSMRGLFIYQKRFVNGLAVIDDNLIFGWSKTTFNMTKLSTRLLKL